MNPSKLAIAAALALLLPGIAAAQSPAGIDLQNASFADHTATGNCGPARIEISGVDVENNHETRRLIPGWNASVKITSGAKSIVIGDGETVRIHLENWNKLHCVSDTPEPRLVLAAYCFSSYCLPVSYTVIDPASLRVLSKGNEDGCDVACAEKALGSRLPQGLVRPLNGG